MMTQNLMEHPVMCSTNLHFSMAVAAATKACRIRTRVCHFWAAFQGSSGGLLTTTDASVSMFDKATVHNRGLQWASVQFEPQTVSMSDCTPEDSRTALSIAAASPGRYFSMAAAAAAGDVAPSVGDHRGVGLYENGFARFEMGHFVTACRQVASSSSLTGPCSFQGIRCGKLRVIWPASGLIRICASMALNMYLCS
jgi:hypothetical protein